ncbi:hypothetical protein K1T35_42985 [Pseudonocardia sp. DSM 110487]|uniref:hypothetical protein n=1 Tax=Pseudonocardia sp. DSM 110487 TaxID=2865833 RepID=UPI001C696E6A|nr:hypothetical protein [Pseudonocardia sp. DSM 110487]QYN35036.1 hypothetical protein K1T35_42985 [Pseudonocardia sp. DSM 110487]
MPPELHLRPDQLRDHARAVSGLADDLHAALRGAPVGFDTDRLQGVVEAAASELAELSGALRGAAAAGIAADAELSATLTRLRDALERR